jgi:flagellar basal-body rod protein FlgF
VLQSLKVSESGMIGQQQKLEILANNLANANTPGFKRLLTTFEAVQPPQRGPTPVNINNPTEPSLRPIQPGSLMRMRTALDLKPGSTQLTGNPLDLAVQGEGFFVIQTPQGERFTRNGSFTLDAEGRLSTRGGSLVLGQGGPIEIPPGAQVEVSSDGSVRAAGTEIGRLKIVRPANRLAFSPEGGTFMRPAPGARAPQSVLPERIRIQAGALEQSNANPISELVQMITAQRIFEAGQRVLSANDEALRKVTTEVPRVG